MDQRAGPWAPCRRPNSRKKCFHRLVKTSLSRVVFRNMTSEAEDRAGEAGSPGGPAGSPGDPGGSAGSPGGAGGAAATPAGTPDEHGRLNLTNPKAIRALAHPMRWAL